MWDCLSKIDIALGIIGFLISIFTAVMSVRVNRKVNTALERKALRENPNEFVGRFDGYIALLGISDIDYPGLKNPLLNDVANIKTFFSFLPRETKKHIKFIESIDFDTINDNSEICQKLRTAIFDLKNYLQKEATK